MCVICTALLKNIDNDKCDTPSLQIPLPEHIRLELNSAMPIHNIENTKNTASDKFNEQ